ncbi:unnamed protein product [Orchesella dallaii]|uniref:Phosphodiesterase n=1 Tax=Orchesella dallaii TaxID=48710 RepID=A0ABP1QEP2_9HEXA
MNTKKLTILKPQDEEKAVSLEGCNTLEEPSDCRVSGNLGSSYGESSSEEVDSSTESLNSSSSHSSASTSSTETEACLLGKEKSREDSSNYQPEIASVLVAPRKPTDTVVSNEQHCKLSKEEKIRIRKLRKKLAAADKEAGQIDKGNKDSDKKNQRHHYQSLNHFPEKLQEKPISDKKLVGYKMFSKLSCVNCMDVLRDCCGVANDEPTNGVKILRRKDPPVDLNADLSTVSNVSVVQRLKLILEKLEAGQLETVPPEVLQKNIQYAIQLIQDGDSIKDRRDESDNELSEVDEEVIPEEVRKWLASTFTKTVQPKPRLEPRPRFRSVANAIRVGLFVDRFYRQLSATTLEIPADVQQLLKEVNNWHFDIFRLHDKSSGHSLKYVAKELFSRYGIVSRFRINLDKLESFLSAVEYGYTKLKNPYHNDIHAADVTQTLHYFIGSTGLANSFTDLEIFSLLFAALIHDFEHTGRTNNFHINVGTELALLYNDRSVLENHHVSAAFRLLRDEDKSLLTNLKPEEFRDFRNLVIEMVLSTDMSTHFAQIKNVRAILNGEKVSSTTTMSLMSLLLHTADISHPGKPWRLHKKFADTILEEFFLQGDEEAKMGLPFSPLCDRNNVLIPESQISFIEFIVEPSLTIMTDLIDLVLNVEDGGPMQITSAPPKTDTSNSGTDSKSAANNSDSANANAVSNSGDDSASKPASNPSSTTTPVANNSDNNSNRNSTTTVSRVPPPVPSRLGAARGQIRPFQNLSSSSGSTGTPGRRTESENCIKTVSSSNNNSSDGGNKLPLSSRTPSFPLQSGSHNYGPVLRPWFNHLVENKAKWRMISAESAAAANAIQQENS